MFEFLLTAEVEIANLFADSKQTFEFSSNAEVRLVDGCGARLTFTQETRVCVPSQAYSLINHNYDQPIFMIWCVWCGDSVLYTHSTSQLKTDTRFFGLQVSLRDMWL